jgi:flagellar protein FliO/FliZ
MNPLRLVNPVSRCLMLLVLIPAGRAVAAAEAAAPAETSDNALIALVVPLLTVVFALAALWWMLHRYRGRGGSAGPVRIVQVVAVGPRERVLVVDCDSRRLLLGITQSSVSLLTELSVEDAATIRSRATSSQMTNTMSTND